MSSIIIARFSYTPGEVVAQKVAARLGYKCVDREVFREASERSGIPQAKLEQALGEGGGFWGMSLASRKVCAAHIQAALAACLLEDDVVYHGPFGSHLIHGVSHILHVRIHAHQEERIALKVEHDGCTAREARNLILKHDRRRRELASRLFRSDDDDNDRYDLVLNTSNVDVDTAVGVIAETVSHSRYKPMTYSLRCMEAQELSCRVRVALIALDREVEVRADRGDVRVRIRAQRWMKKRRISVARRRATEIEGVKSVEIEPVEDSFDRIIGSRRLR